MATYRLDILVTAQDRASTPLHGVHSALSRILYVATGVLIAQAVRGVLEFFGGMITGAFEAHDRLERLGFALETLVAVEISRGQQAEETSTFVRHLTESEILTVDKLRLQYFALQTQLGELQTEYAEVTAEYGEHSMEALAVSVALRETQGAMGDLGTEIERLNGLEGSLVTTTKTVTTGQLDMGEAMRQAVGPAKDLLNWISQLALVSPFLEEDVFRVFNMAAGFGFATQFASHLATQEERLAAAQDEGVVTAQRLTLALLDLGAVFPTVADALPRILKGLGDMKAAGRVLALDLRQLYNAGITMEFLAYSMGLTVAEFQELQAAGLSADEMILALVETIENEFGGASERMLDTLAGLKLAFADLGPMLGRLFIDPLIKALIPALREFFDLMATPEAFAAATSAGEKFRDIVLGIGKAIGIVVDFLRTPLSIRIEALHIPDLFTPEEEGRIAAEMHQFFNGIWRSVMPQEVQEQISGQIQGLFDTLRGLFQRAKEDNFGLHDPEAAGPAATGAFGAVLGIGGLLKILAPGGRFWAVLSGAFGIISTIALKIFGKLGLVGLGVSILAAAWAGNWLGIRTTVTEAWEGTIKPFLLNDLPGILTETLPKKFEEFKIIWEETIIAPLVAGLSAISLAAQRLANTGLAVLNAAWVLLGLYLQENVLPPIRDLKEFLLGQAGVVAGFVALGLALGGEMFEGLTSFLGPWLVAWGTPIIDAIKWVVLEAFPALLGFFIQLRTEEATYLMGFVQNALIPMWETLGKMGAVLLEKLIPAWAEIILLIKDFSENQMREFHRAYEEFAKPVLEGLWDLFENHVIPLAEEFWGLLGDIATLSQEFFSFAWKQYLEPALLGFANFLANVLNIKVENLGLLLGGIFTLIDVDLSRAINWLVDNVLPGLQSAFSSLKGILDGIASALRTIRDLLAEIEVPDPIEQHSPSEMELAFLGVANAIEQVNDAYNRSKAFNISGFRTAGSGSQGSSVYFAGDNNTFVVQDQGMANYLAHQLREMKRKRFDSFMGRGR